MNQDWNDPKSQLQQCCLTLRELEGGEPDIPIYKYVFVGSCRPLAAVPKMAFVPVKYILKRATFFIDRMIASTGPTNTRKYTVAVYFRRKRLATGTGHSIQMAEMAAATNALQDKSSRFPFLLKTLGLAKIIFAGKIITTLKCNLFHM